MQFSIFRGTFPLAVALAMDLIGPVASRAQPAAAPPPSLRDTLRGEVFDEHGKPMAGVIVSNNHARLWGQPVNTLTDATGNFRLNGRPGYWRSGTLIATTPNHEHQSYVKVHEEHALPRRLEIMLKPPRKTFVTVVDGAGKPVSGATVEVIGDYSSVAVSATDGAGRAELWFPADVKIDWVLAFKDDVGFDYHENYKAFPTNDRGPLAEDIRLTLDGARPDVVAEAETPDGKPLAGIGVLLWTVKKPGKLSYANIGGSLSTRRLTDADGRAHFAFLPRLMAEGVSFLVHSDDYHATESLHIPTGDAGPLHITLKPNVTIRGQLTFADGSPAPQILLQAEGNGSPHYFRGFARSDEEGNYAFSVYADQTYAVNVLDDDWAARSHTGEQVQLGDQPHVVNFQLVPGTLIEGNLTIGPDHAPAVGETATLLQEPQFVRWSNADEQGYYRFRVGPGNYKLRFPSGMTPAQLDVKVNDQASIVNDAHAERKARDQLQGTVRAGEDNAPVADVVVSGESVEHNGHAGFHAVTDAEGHFQTERWTDVMFAIARDVAGNRADTALLVEDDKTCNFKLAPAATLVGRAVDETGQPLAQARVFCAISMPDDWQLPGDEPGKPHNNRKVTLQLAANADGTFKVPAVPLGVKAELYVDSQKGNSGSKDFRAKEPGEFVAGDIAIKGKDPAAPR
ncbi:MAG TPA: carboxypeptidase-like regulatory domain-containing protein [Pirellulales bacterium]